MPGGMNSFNQMEHAQAQARKAVEAAQQAQHPQGGTNDATLQAQAQQAQAMPVDQASAVPMQQAGVMPGQQVQQQPQEGQEDLIDSVQNGTATDMKGKPFANTLKSAKEAFAQMLSQVESEEAEPNPSMQGNPNVAAVDQPETVEPGEGVEVQPQSTTPPEHRSMEDIVREAVASVLTPEGQGKPQSVPESAEEKPGTSEPEIEIPDINSDEFYEKFTENPGEAIQMVADALSEKKFRDLKTQLQPLLEQSDKLREEQRASDAIRKFAENGYDDFQDYKDDIVRFMQERQLPIDDPNAYENAYNFSKARRLQADNDVLRQNQGKTLDDYFGDADSIDRMSANEQVKKMVIEKYLKELQDGQSPQVITGGSGNTTAATPRNSVKSIKEAGRLFAQSMNQ